MVKSLVISLVVLVAALGAGAAMAQPPGGCQYFNLKIDTRNPTLVAPPPLPPYDYDVCVEHGKITGNLKGKYLFCLYSADFAINSDSIYGDGFVQLGAGRYASRIETAKGSIEFTERSWYDADFGLEIGFSKALGGTGDFEGAAGMLFWQGVRFPVPGQLFLMPFEGYICTP